MAHLRCIEDDMGDVVNYDVFCSDSCHQQFCQDNDHQYQGWNGCHEISYTQPCQSCEATVHGIDETTER